MLTRRFSRQQSVPEVGRATFATAAKIWKQKGLGLAVKTAPSSLTMNSRSLPNLPSLPTDESDAAWGEAVGMREPPSQSANMGGQDVNFPNPGKQRPPDDSCMNID